MKVTVDQRFILLLIFLSACLGIVFWQVYVYMFRSSNAQCNLGILCVFQDTGIA